ncbi:head maturation protease, ClpP-related [Psychrobacillus sp. FSL H8-0510]|uniref:head maturation protease, ClpP-related n=1 Tax=Psychrobacillus sp. FSL H8-0510 TaxID=2921394 RepID=UPI0030F84763
MKHKIKGDFTSWNSSIYDFNYKMRTIKEDEDIELEINSYGGDVFLGIDLCNTLRAHKGHVTVIIPGIAASAASIGCMGADTIKAYSNSQVMVHNAWTIVAGNAKELRKSANDLDSIGESVLASYTHRVDASVITKLLDDETYLSAAKAKELGLIDEIIDAVDIEEVESELFINKAKEFNNQINKISASASTVEDNEELIQIKAQMLAMQNELEQLKNTEPEKPTPVKQNRAVRLF